MSFRSLVVALGACALLAPRGSQAQPMAPLDLPASSRIGDVPTATGTGASALAVHGFFRGFPSSIADARDLLDARSIAPAFRAWCGTVPYVDFTNGTVLDSQGREGPTVLCLPFLDPARMMPAHTCAASEGVPTGTYDQGGGLVMRLEGSVALRESGVYTFAWGHDDGVSMRFGDATVFEYPDPTGSRVDRRAVRVDRPGRYAFTLEWYDTIGGALLDWYVARGDATDGTFDAARFSLVRREDLYPSESAPCTARCERCEGETPVCDRAARRCVRCLTDAMCGPCGVCREGACVGDAGRCAADASADGAVDDGATVEADGGLDAATGAPPPAGGCGCATTTDARAGLAWVALCVLAPRRRVRRGKRR